MFVLKPHQPKQPEFQLGALVWPWMLLEGVGLAIGVSRGLAPGSYNLADPERGSPLEEPNGFHVTAPQARAMALAARGLAKSQGPTLTVAGPLRALAEIDDQLVNVIENADHIRPLNRPRGYFDILLEFATWAEKSGGFWVW